MCHGCKIDTSTSDLPRPMRCRGRTTRRRGAWRNRGQRPVYGGLAAAHAGDSENEADRTDVTPLAAGTPWQRRSPAHDERADVPQGRQGRAGPSRFCFHTAKKLMGWVCREPRAQGAPAGEQTGGQVAGTSPEEIEHALDTAYGRASNGSYH
jgi:hypothetical protein